MDLQSLNQERYVSVTNSPLWKHKNASDRAQIQRKLQKHLASDILCLYEKSQFVDLKLESPEGHILSHRVIVAGRSPCFWSLLAQIGRVQLRHQVGERSRSAGILTFLLPTGNFDQLKAFIRSLYTNEVDEIAGITLRIQLENYLVTLKQSLACTQTLYLEKLNSEEEQELEKIFLSQLQTGEISAERGNLRDVTHLVPVKLKCRQQRKRLRPFGQFERNGIEGVREAWHLSPCSSSRIPVSAKKQVFTDHVHTIPYERYNSTPTMNPESVLRKFSGTGGGNKSSKKQSVLTERDKTCTRPGSQQESDLDSSTKAKSTSSEDNTVIHYSRGTSIDNDKKNKAPPNSNGIVEPAKTGFFPGVRAKVRKMKMLRKSSSESFVRGKIPQYFSTPKVKSLETEAKRLTLGDEDSTTSDSDPNGPLHETSSLEVELPSSIEDQSLSPDSVKSDNKYPAHENANPDDDPSENPSIDANKEQPEGPVEPPLILPHPHKPLVRTRTFDLIEPTCAAVSLEGDDKKDLSSAETEKLSCPSDDAEPSSAVNAESRPTTEEDAAKLRELERKKGSLLFEHNLQTFSNIPATNMMNVSISSDGSVGLGSMYNSMLENAMLNCMSVSSGGEPHRPDHASYLSKSLHEMECFLQPRPALHLVAQPSQEDKRMTTLADTRSPSPDSLCVDQEAPTSARSDKNSLSKEDLNFEEKEMDEGEIASKSDSNSSQENIEEYFPQKDKFSSDFTISGIESPRISRKEDEKPIVSGGSILRKDTVKQSKGESHPGKTERQISCGSVKDVDAIPLVCGYVSPGIEKEASMREEEEESQGQSMFSMFINLNEIPSPVKEPAPEPKSQPSGGMYMFIEADNVPSPKTKRRSKPELEINRPQKAANKHEDPVAKFEGGLCNSPIHAVKDKETPTTANGNNKKATPASRQDENKNDDETATPVSKTDEEKPSVVTKSEPEEKTPLTPQNIDDKSVAEDKNSFFVFIAAESASKTSSPRTKRRPAPQRRTTKPQSNVMSKSAPSDCLLFSKDDSSKSSATENSAKMMTKSVIDREEFMAQPPARRNVSLNDKINESSKIPRPVTNFKEKLSLESARKDAAAKKDAAFVPSKEHSSFKKKKKKVVDLNGVKSFEASLSEAATSMSVSFSDMSNSLQADLDEASEFSDVSSLLSSIDRSNEPSDPDRAASRTVLGDDLLKMLLDEINTDVTIQVGEKRIRAHKCILASRCVYFAAMLSGHWVESAGNVIKLQGFSAEAMMIALKHIYSGSSTVPDDVEVEELAALADMLALDGLKEVVSLHLKANMCHYFHKPCPECVSGVMSVLPTAAASSLEDLYHKCLKWVAKHLAVVLPTKSFAALPSELQDRCSKQVLDDMSVGNVLDTVIGGSQILSSLPTAPWTQPVFVLVVQLWESATNFIAANLNGVLASDRFLELGHESHLDVGNLEDTFKMACELIRPDQAVLSHIQLTKLLEAREEDGDSEYVDGFLSMTAKLLNQIEKFMIHNANRVAVCRQWPLLPTEAQKRIKDAALVVVEFSKPLVPRPKFTSASRIRSRGSSMEPTQRLRTSSMSDHRLSRSSSATVVPANGAQGGSAAKKMQPSSGRCHTPPPSTLRPPLQTPPPTRASTLRAQARQAAIQRSQSARTVAEKNKKIKPVLSDMTSMDNDSCSSSGGAVRGGTSSGPFPRSRTSSQNSFGTFSSVSRSSTPGLSDRTKHKRNASGPLLMPANRTFHGGDDDVFQRKHSGGAAPHPPPPQPHREFLRAHSSDSHQQQKAPRSSSIGTSPLHHLTSLRENAPREARKFHPLPTTSRGQSRTPVKQRTRSPPLRDANHVATDSQDNYRAFSSKVNNNKPMTTGEDQKRECAVEVIIGGLGSRSNTFCKDDRPTPPPTTSEIIND